MNLNYKKYYESHLFLNISFLFYLDDLHLKHIKIRKSLLTSHGQGRSDLLRAFFIWRLKILSTISLLCHVLLYACIVYIKYKLLYLFVLHFTCIPLFPLKATLTFVSYFPSLFILSFISFNSFSFITFLFTFLPL